jgi:4-nitrophenyl phosphatase
VRVAFLTNNSSQTVSEIVAKLQGFDIPTDPADVLTSALAAARLLAGTMPARSSVIACAGPGAIEALQECDLRVVLEAPADAVVVGFHRSFDFDGLDRASRAVRDGARFVATNTDATYPVADGLVPGAGAIVAAVATASGRTPEIAGKPHPPTVAMVREQLGDQGIVVGDRPSTDGALADALGWPFALVLTGVTNVVAPPGGEGVPDPPPPFVAPDLAALVPELVRALAAA